MRKALTMIVALALCFTVAAWWFVHQLDVWAQAPKSIPGEVIVELRPRMTLPFLSRQLADKEVITDHTKFQLWMRLTGGYGKFQAGNYLFTGDVSPRQVRDKIMRGENYVPSVLQVAIPEGFTLRLLNERIATKGVAQMPELTKLIHDNQFLRELGVNSTSLEGYTYPATYNFEKMPTAREFYAKVVGKFFENLSPDYVAQITKRGLTLNQAVTFASLIELETMQETEKPLIAEVIWRRLKKGDALGIDAAVIYGISDYQGDITWQHLKDAKNPYNTRIHRGLPPTAIGAVTKTSLDAVLNPTNLGYYYYMLDSDDRTRHVFSRTGSEHNVQVQRFLKAQKTELKRRPQQP